MAFKTVQILPVFPDFPQFEETVTLGGLKWVLRFTWRDRLRAWFMDIYNDALAPVVEGRRLSPFTDVAFGRLDFPGKLNVIGDDSERLNLGPRLHVVYMEFD